MNLRMCLLAIGLLSAAASAEPASGTRAAPQGKSFGLGLVFGSPSGLTGKYMLTADQGIQASIGFGVSSRFRQNFAVVTDILLAVDYIWTPATLVDVAPMTLNFFIGGGAVVGIYENGFFGPTLGARLPVGLSMAFKPIPLEIYLELVPTLIVFPPVALGLGAGLGGRWYF
jgi:hypothetical protein